MKSQVLNTPVDEVVEYIKKHPNSTILSISKAFKINEELVDRWISVLEEAGILKVQFKGIEPQITYIDQTKKKKIIRVDGMKEAFTQACYRKKISTEKMKELWKLFFQVYEEEIKEQFSKECIENKIERKKIPIAWERFKQNMREL